MVVTSKLEPRLAEPLDLPQPRCHLVPTDANAAHHRSLSIAGLRFHQNAHQLIQLRLHLRDPHKLNLLLLLNTLELLSDLGYLVDVLQCPLHLVL